MQFHLHCHINSIYNCFSAFSNFLIYSFSCCVHIPCSQFPRDWFFGGSTQQHFETMITYLVCLLFLLVLVCVLLFGFGSQHVFLSLHLLLILQVLLDLKGQLYKGCIVPGPTASILGVVSTTTTTISLSQSKSTTTGTGRAPPCPPPQSMVKIETFMDEFITWHQLPMPWHNSQLLHPERWRIRAAAAARAIVITVVVVTRMMMRTMDK